jgi:hypothetical protein
MGNLRYPCGRRGGRMVPQSYSYPRVSRSRAARMPLKFGKIVIYLLF